VRVRRRHCGIMTPISYRRLEDFNFTYKRKEVRP
jgi:hypothetical protein